MHDPKFPSPEDTQVKLEVVPDDELLALAPLQGGEPPRPTAPRAAPLAAPTGYAATPIPSTSIVDKWSEPYASAPDSMAASVGPSVGAVTRELFGKIDAQLRKIFIGQDELVLGTLVALFSGGHVLIESAPGLGKTLFVRSLGRVLGCAFGRVQFTADLMPSDITGAPIFDMKTQDFRFRPGPVFTQFLLADEINRSPAKTHAALLEIMQEYRVTVDGVSHPLEKPFLVLATQNPIESEGTYNLPEAQLDRFMFKIIANYPSVEEEAAILRLHTQQLDLEAHLARLERVTSAAEILQVTRACATTRVNDKLIDYINQVTRLTRQWPTLHLGASPRAGIALLQGSRAMAAFMGRDYVVPDDVVRIALPALRHRVALTAEAEVEGRQVDEVLGELLRSVEVPRL